MTIGVIARVTILPGKGKEFEAAFAVQAKGVRANEPGNRLYQLVKSREDDNTYVVMELYDSDADLEAHRSAEHMVANRPAMAPLIGGKTVVEIYDAV
ncbi:MAG: putative quinol monooxygenase [Phenylobacterium sp.]